MAKELFSASELKEMKEFYLLEQQKLSSQLAHIQKILSKLGEKSLKKETETSSAPKGKRGRPRKNPDEAPKAKSGLGRGRPRKNPLLVNTEPKALKRRGRPRKEQSQESNTEASNSKSNKEPKVSKWSQFILQKLQEADKPLSAEELSKLAMEGQNQSEENKKSINQSILSNIFRLKKAGNQLNLISIKGRGKFLTLPNWYDENGLIKNEYVLRLKE